MPFRESRENSSVANLILSVFIAKRLEIRDTQDKVTKVCVRTVVVTRFEANADGRDFGTPLPVGETPVDLLTVETAQRVTFLAVIPG